ncbi:NADP-dependent isocitrate dehydrogenase [Blattabacterium cuenoti]|uniref:NADP-dependent isocitrate dehydrogenase n=1 Tax=Blattabacterium cuenoti TaxID=1653831 RepID=UPI00163CC05A|nr:NADP-dependent isocitrate dehydrogenase [Blattabacterium cuenoti]
MKIKVTNPIVEMDGDEMARIIWKYIKKYFIYPYLDIKIIYFDLGLKNRNYTNDQVTIDAAKAIKKYNVGVKCATITPDKKRMKEFNLKKMWKSPNGTIRNIINGTIFREPIIINNFPKKIKNWKYPICIARHAYADQYDSVDFSIKNKGTLYLHFIPDNLNKNNEKKIQIHHFSSPGIAMGMYNTEKSIYNFALSCFNYSIYKKYSLFLSTKNTILKYYDGKYVDIFKKLYKSKFESKFKKLNIKYEHYLIDDMISKVIKSNGGFIWACKNYDGDVQSDCIAQGFGSLGMMTSILLTADGKTFESEAAHGTITRHYKKYKKGIITSTNPIALLFAWTKALKHRAYLDNNDDLRLFSEKIEKSCKTFVEEGNVTKDLLLSMNNLNINKYLDTESFIKDFKKFLEKKLKI